MESICTQRTYTAHATKLKPEYFLPPWPPTGLPGILPLSSDALVKAATSVSLGAMGAWETRLCCPDHRMVVSEGRESAPLLLTGPGLQGTPSQQKPWEDSA